MIDRTDGGSVRVSDFQRVGAIGDLMDDLKMFYRKKSTLTVGSDHLLQIRPDSGIGNAK